MQKVTNLHGTANFALLSDFFCCQPVCKYLWAKRKFMCFFKSRFVVFGVPGRAPGGVRESRTGHFTKSAQKCLGAFRGPTLARKTRDHFARSRSRCGSGAIFRNYRAFYALKWLPDLPRDTFREIDDIAISALPAPPAGAQKLYPGKSRIVKKWNLENHQEM